MMIRSVSRAPPVRIRACDSRRRRTFHRSDCARYRRANARSSFPRLPSERDRVSDARQPRNLSWPSARAEKSVTVHDGAQAHRSSYATATTDGSDESGISTLSLLAGIGIVGSERWLRCAVVHQPGVNVTEHLAVQAMGRGIGLESHPQAAGTQCCHIPSGI